MAGMKNRFTRIKNFALKRAQVGSLGILTLLLAFAVPLITAQENPKTSKPAQSLLAPKSTVGNPAGSEASPVGAITDIKVAPEDGKLTVTLATDRLLTPKELMLQNPSRLVLDFPCTENKVKFSQLPVNSALVKQLRVNQFQSSDPKTVRVVFDLAEGYWKYELALDRTSVRIVFRQGQGDQKPKPTIGPVESAAAHPLPDLLKAGAKAEEQEPRQENRPSTVPAARKVAQPAKAIPIPDSPKSVVKHEEQKPRQETIGQATAPVKTNVVSDLPKSSAVTHPLPDLLIAGAKVEEQNRLSMVPAARKVAQPAKVSPISDSPKSVVKNEEQKPRQEAIGQPTAPVKTNAVPDLPKYPSTAVEKPLQEARPAQTAQTLSASATPISAPVAAYNPPTPRPAAQANSRFSGQPLTLDLINTSLVDFFRLMAEEGGINIVLDPEVKGNISIKVVKLPWDQIFEAALINNDLDKQVEGNLVRIARKSTLQNEAKQQESLKKANLLAADLETRIKRLNYAKAGALIKALEDQKTVRGTAVVDDRTNSLILTDIPSSLDKLYQLIDTLDTPQPQVEIEARIVSATRDFARDIGFQFGFVEGNLQRVTVGGPNTFGTIGGTRPSATPTSTFAAGLNGRGASQDTASQSGAVSTGPAGNYNVNLPATKAFGGLGVSIGNIFDTFLLDAAITAGESKGLAKLISQPKVTAQNNNPAVITQGLRFPVPVVANNTVTVQFFNAALTLTATPQITYEGNIILDLKVENNSPDFGRSVNGVPSIRTSESTTRVLISDGGTTVIGGILLDEESTQEDKVPGLGSLPLIGNLFRRSSVSRTTQEVLFFVTPRLLK
jgi:type IV pilus secretin PilQ/predicted competence protein